MAKRTNEIDELVVELFKNGETQSNIAKEIRGF